MSIITRRLPQSPQSRHQALRRAKQRKDAVGPADTTLRAATGTELDTFNPIYVAAHHTRQIAKQAYHAHTPVKNAAIDKLRMFNSHFIQHLNQAIERGELTIADRIFYTLDETDDKVPSMGTEQDVIDWAQNIITGEADRITAGGTALTQPSAAQIQTLLTDANGKLTTQANNYTAYNNAQEAFDLLHPTADTLIRSIWNEVESSVDKDPDAGSRREKAALWGVVYVTVGEKKVNIEIEVLDTDTNAPIENATIEFENASIELTTNANGKATASDDYNGEDTLTVQHLNYVTQTMAVTLVNNQNFKLTVKLTRV